VEITLLPQAPETIAGVINVQGRIIPVMDCRKRFHAPPREVALSDQLLLARIARRTVALLVDRVEGVIEAAADEIVDADQILPGIDALGAVKLPDGSIVLIHDFERSLSREDVEVLESAMQMT
jgi:purine-binding chemotaxis protein CheW